MTERLINDGTDPTLVPRIAAKEWRCICADEVKHIEITRTCEHGTTTGRLPRDTDVDAWVMAERGTPCHGGKSPQDEHFDIVFWPNRNYRPDCLGSIHVGDAYLEYMGESAAWESGSRYCWKCALAVWGPHGIKAPVKA